MVYGSKPSAMTEVLKMNKKKDKWNWFHIQEK